MDFTYHNKPEKRSEIDREGFITSGDVLYRRGRLCLICDRKRDMVISGGVNIYPAEIEAAHAVPRRPRLRGVRHSGDESAALMAWWAATGA
jgi:acyl-CoA synthetase (AMP-forming)/AMP-acid ligase II